MRTLLLSLFAVLLSTAFVAAADEKKDEKQPDLFPLVKGTTWEYEVAVMGQNKDVVQKVAKLTPGKKGERTIATIESKVDEQSISEEMSADDKAVYRHAMQGMKLETPLAIVKYPYKAGDKWKEKIKIGTEEAEANFEAFKTEEVKVAAGKYTAYPIVMEMDVMCKKVVSKNWYVDGIGIVKQEVDFAGLKITMELKKFTKGKKDD